MEKTINYKKISLVIIITMVVLICLTITYALIKFNSGNTNINVNSQGIDDYVNYQQGTSILSSDNQKLNATWDYTGGISTSIEFWKDANPQISLHGYLYMDIKQIGVNLRTEEALKWAVVRDGNLLNEGSFLNKNVNDSITISLNEPLQDTQQFYTVYIWLDDHILSNYDVVGETISVEVRAEAY